VMLMQRGQGAVIVEVNQHRPKGRGAEAAGCQGVPAQCNEQPGVAQQVL